MSKKKYTYTFTVYGVPPVLATLNKHLQSFGTDFRLPEGEPMKVCDVDITLNEELKDKDYPKIIELIKDPFRDVYGDKVEVKFKEVRIRLLDK